MTWSNEDMLKLIASYRERPSLWDSAHSEYKDRNKRHDALTEIAISFGVEKNEIERKIKYLQSHFSRERKKELKSRRTGYEEIYESKWFAYNSLLFMADKNKPRKTVDNVKDVTDYHGEENDRLEEGVEDQEVDPTEPPYSQEKNAEANISTKTLKRKEFRSLKNPKAKRSRTTPAGTPVNEAVNLLKSIQSKRADRDEFKLFGKLVAMKLRRLTSPQSRFLAQNAINKILFEAEIGMYEHYEPSDEPNRFVQHPQLPYDFKPFQAHRGASNSGTPMRYPTHAETTYSNQSASSPEPSRSPSSGSTPERSPPSPSSGYSPSP